MISLHNLKKKYGNFEALSGVNFEVKKGEILGLLGPNGAGKTTTMKIITGFLTATSGTVEVDGHDVAKDTLIVQREIGYLPENTPLYPELNVYEHLDFTAQAHGLTGDEKEKAIKKVVKSCGLDERVYFNISELSKGYKQRVGLAQALVHNPKILILDEPTTGLDPNQIIEIRDLIRKIGKEKTVILSTHIMQEVEATCNRVIVLAKGKVVAKGSPDELMKGEDNTQETKIVVKGAKRSVLAALKKSGLEDVTTEDTLEKGAYIYRIKTEEDKRAIISTTIVTGKFDLLEMTSEKKSLETVFQELTK